MPATLQQLVKEAPRAAELAALASIAARIDRAVLRALRLEILAPDADATVESDLWFSDLVARRGPDIIVLHTDHLPALRDQLVASQKLSRARAVVVAAHADGPPLLKLEEELIYLGLVGAKRSEIEDRLGQALVTLRADKDRALDIASWALLALPRLPESVRDTAAAWSLAFAAERQLGYSVNIGANPPTDALFLDASVPSVPLSVGWSKDRLLLGGNDGPTLNVPATTPRVLTVDSATGRQVIAIEPGRLREVPVSGGEAVLGNLRGERWRARQVAEPAPREELSAPENGFWILIDGTEAFELPPRHSELARAIGRHLAQAGFSLVTLGRSGVSHVVAQEFWQVLVEQRYPSGRYRMLHVVAEGDHPDFSQAGSILQQGSPESFVSAAVARADAALLIGNSSLTKLGDALHDSDMPVLSLGELTKESANEYSAAQIQFLRERLKLDPEAYAGNLQDILQRAALTLDEPEFVVFQQSRDALEKSARSVVPVELARQFLHDDRRPSHRLLGYLVPSSLTPDVLRAALFGERRTVQFFWDVRTLLVALEVLRRTRGSYFEGVSDESASALAALCGSILVELGAIPPTEPLRRCESMLRQILEQNERGRRAMALAELAKEYVSVRATNEAGDERTAMMGTIVNQIASEHVRTPSISEVTMWWSSGSAAQRVVALGLILGAPTPIASGMVADAISDSYSAFEQYTALRVAHAMFEQLKPDDLVKLRKALLDARSGPRATITQSDPSRWSSSTVLLRQIEDRLRETPAPTPARDLESRARFADGEGDPGLNVDLLIVCMLEEELSAVLEVFARDSGRTAESTAINGRIYLDLGLVNGTRVFVKRLQRMGASGSEFNDALIDLHPGAVVMVGVAAGRSAKTQALGDILVSREIVQYAPQKQSQQESVYQAGPLHASGELIDYLEDAEASWRGAKVHFGSIGVSDRLLSSHEAASEADVPDGGKTIGLEMEGVGLMSTAEFHQIDWIVVKGVTDFADGSKADDPPRRLRATRNAAEFLLHALNHAPLKGSYRISRSVR